MGVAQLLSSRGMDGMQMNTISRLRTRSWGRAACWEVLLSVTEVSLPGNSVATHPACVTWSLWWRPGSEPDCMGYVFSV